MRDYGEIISSIRQDSVFKHVLLLKVHHKVSDYSVHVDCMSIRYKNHNHNVIRSHVVAKKSFKITQEIQREVLQQEVVVIR